MKRFIALVLVIGLFASFGVLGANAVEAVNTETVRQPLSDEELDNLAAEAFPEYADRILNPPTTSTTNSTRSNVKVIDETRQISDTERITYIEYADGRGSIVFVTEVYEGSTSAGTNYTTKVLDFQIRHVFMPGSMYISGFTYTIVNGGYDYINSPGSFSCTAENGMRTAYRAQENANADAELTYSCVFDMSNVGDFMQATPISCIFQILVGNDTISYNAY